ncbi:MAG: hypothetical protein ACXQS8_00070 [Candidatus Helarchaeales archaeon]
MASRELALFGQILNTCGLAATLMMLNPEKTRIATLLDDICVRIRLDPEEHRPINWQIACGYLLLKAMKNELLLDRLHSELADVIDYHAAMLENQILEKRQRASKHFNVELKRATAMYLKHGVVQKILLMDYLNDYKTNLELRILNALFGATSVLFDSTDGTGSLIIDSISQFKKNFSLLNECVENGLLLGLPGHWVAVKSITKEKKEYAIQVHDSRSGVRTISISKSKGRFMARFYAFKYSPEKQLEMEALIRKALRLRKNPQA